MIGRPGVAAAACRAGDGLGDEADDLVVADDAEVIVGQQRDRPAALARAAVEHDRPGLGDPQGAGGQDAVAARRAARWSGPGRGAARRPAGIQPAGRSAGTTSLLHAPRGAGRGDRRGRSAAATRRTVGLVLGDALDELLDQLVARRRVGRQVVDAVDRRRPRASRPAGTSRRACADRGRGSCGLSRRLLAGLMPLASSTIRGRSAGPPGRRRASRSSRRAWPGRCSMITPSRMKNRWPNRPSFCVRSNRDGLAKTPASNFIASALGVGPEPPVVRPACGGRPRRAGGPGPRGC